MEFIEQTSESGREEREEGRRGFALHPYKKSSLYNSRRAKVTNNNNRYYNMLEFQITMSNYKLERVSKAIILSSDELIQTHFPLDYTGFICVCMCVQK